MIQSFVRHIDPFSEQISCLLRDKAIFYLLLYTISANRFLSSRSWTWSENTANKLCKITTSLEMEASIQPVWSNWTAMPCICGLDAWIGKNSKSLPCVLNHESYIMLKLSWGFLLKVVNCHCQRVLFIVIILNLCWQEVVPTGGNLRAAG